MSSVKYRFKALDTIGAADAEDDQFLSNCFVDTGYLDSLKDLSDPRRILLGRTGTGKTALLLKLRESYDRVIFLPPENLALNYVSNSQILSFLFDAGVNFDIFFKLLWRHVFTVEIIRKRFALEDETQTNNWFFSFIRRCTDRRQEEALQYIKKWGTSFWKETDYRIKELTRKLESNIEGSLDIAIPGAKTNICAGSHLEDTQKAEVVSRAQHVVNEVQIRELTQIIDLIDKVLDDPQKPYFIALDHLDEEWVDDAFRYRLIRSLIETSRDFQRVRHAKVLISLREDLLQRVFRKTRSAGFQQEKYESRCLPIKWAKENLIELLDKRINYLVKGTYVKTDVKLQDLLPNKQIARKEDPIDFILDRTHLRPRDVIAFLNHAIAKAAGRPKFSQSVLKSAEKEYSLSRVRAMIDEWHGDYPNLNKVTKLIYGFPTTFLMGEISDESINEFCLVLVTDNLMPREQDCLIYQTAVQLIEEKSSVNVVRQQFCFIFYEIGLLGIKLGPQHRFMFSHIDGESIRVNELGLDTKLTVHKGLRSALGIVEK